VNQARAQPGLGRGPRLPRAEPGGLQRYRSRRSRSGDGDAAGASSAAGRGVAGVAAHGFGAHPAVRPRGHQRVRGVRQRETDQLEGAQGQGNEQVVPGPQERSVKEGAEARPSEALAAGSQGEKRSRSTLLRRHCRHRRAASAGPTRIAGLAQGVPRRAEGVPDAARGEALANENDGGEVQGGLLEGGE